MSSTLPFSLESLFIVELLTMLAICIQTLPPSCPSIINLMDLFETPICLKFVKGFPLLLGKRQTFLKYPFLSNHCMPCYLVLTPCLSHWTFNYAESSCPILSGGICLMVLIIYPHQSLDVRQSVSFLYVSG